MIKFKEYLIALIAAILTTMIILIIGKITGWNLDYFNGWVSATVYILVKEYFNKQ